MTNYDGRLTLLSDQDNVFVARLGITAEDSVQVGGSLHPVQRPVSVGYKLARQPISEGEKIVKSGAVIGSATRAIAPGERVHTENMQSDYIAIHTNSSDASHVAEKDQS